MCMMTLLYIGHGVWPRKGHAHYLVHLGWGTGGEGASTLFHELAQFIIQTIV
jgi:hypothetical protein